MLWLTVPDATTSIPSTSWEHLAGTTETNTIVDSDEDAINYRVVAHNTQSLISHNGRLHFLIRGLDPIERIYTRAVVAQKQDDGSWNLLGGDEGARFSSDDEVNRYPQALYSFDGDLYLAYREYKPTDQKHYLRVDRWNTSTDTWNTLTTQSTGIHHDKSWTAGAVQHLSFDSSYGFASFLEIAGNLHIVFGEQGTSAGLRAIVGSSFNGTTFTRQVEEQLTSPTGGVDFMFVSSASDGDAIYLPRHSNVLTGYSFLHKYDGNSISYVNNDTGEDASFFGSQPTFYGRSLFFDQGKLISLYQGGSLTTSGSIYVRESTDGGQSFSTTQTPSLPSGYVNLYGGYIQDGTLYVLCREGDGFGDQPTELSVFRRDGSSWTALGGGSVTTSNTKNADFPAWMFFINSSPYVHFKQSSFYDSGGNGSVPDDKIYLAWTAP